MTWPRRGKAVGIGSLVVAEEFGGPTFPSYLIDYLHLLSKRIDKHSQYIIGFMILLRLDLWGMFGKFRGWFETRSRDEGRSRYLRGRLLKTKI